MRTHLARLSLTFLVLAALAGADLLLFGGDAEASPASFNMELDALAPALSNPLSRPLDFQVVCPQSPPAQVKPDAGVGFAPYGSVWCAARDTTKVYYGGSNVDNVGVCIDNPASTTCHRDAFALDIAQGDLFCTTGRTAVDGGPIDSGTPGSDGGFVDAGYNDAGAATLDCFMARAQ